MNDTIITEFDSDTPMHMIEPMNDSIFSVVPVKYKKQHHSAEHAGHGTNGR